MTVLLAFLVLVGVAAMLAYPLFRPGPQPPPDPVGPAAELAALEERKLQVYAAIREIGFDYRMDKLERADYEEEVERLKSDATDLVRRIDALSNQPPRGADEIEAEIEAARKRLESADDGDPVFCTQCGEAAAEDDRFCRACGAPLRASE